MIQFDYFIIFFKCFFFNPSTHQPVPFTSWKTSTPVESNGVHQPPGAGAFSSNAIWDGTGLFTFRGGGGKVDGWRFLKDGPFLKRPRQKSTGVKTTTGAGLPFFFWGGGLKNSGINEKKGWKRLETLIFFCSQRQQVGKDSHEFYEFQSFSSNDVFILVHKCKRPRFMRHPKVTKVPRVFQVARRFLQWKHRAFLCEIQRVFGDQHRSSRRVGKDGEDESVWKAAILPRRLISPLTWLHWSVIWNVWKINSLSMGALCNLDGPKLDSDR